jgi:hypothetical protein
MPTTIADVLIDELALILERRDHPPRLRQDPPQAAPPAAAEAAANAVVPPAPADGAVPPAAAPGDGVVPPAAQAAPVDPAAAARAETIRKVKAAVAAAPDADAQMMCARLAMLDEHVTGLSLSGGGIRSGTFAVGFLQGLANLRLLGRFDYLSTVSGGGYAGGWLTAWLKREGDVTNVERQIDFSRVRQAEAERGHFQWDLEPRPAVDEEPEPLRHLRSFSSYLFPNPSPLSVDTWSVIVIWLRNVLINLLMLFPLAMLAALAARLGVFFFNFLNADNISSVTWGWFFANMFLIAGAVAAMVALGLNASSLPEFRTPNRPRSEHARGKAWVAVIATLVAAYGLTVSSRWMLWHLGEWVEGLRVSTGDNTILNNLIGLATGYLELMQLPSFLLVMGIFALFMSVGSVLNGWKYGGFRGRFVAAAAIAGASSGFLFVLVLGMIQGFARMNRPDLMTLLAIPGALGVVIGSIVVEVAIAGRVMTEAEREWWSRFNARLAIATILWLVGIGATLYLPAAYLSAGTYARLAIASGWLGTTAMGVLTGRFVLPRLQAKGSGQLLARVAAIAPPIFLVGLLGLLGLLASLLLNVPGLNVPHGDDLTPFAYYLEGVRGTSVWMILLLGFVFGGLALLGFNLIDVNLFSLNAMYANRLIRCYLGASRRMKDWKARWDDQTRDMRVNTGAPSISLGVDLPSERDPNPVTGFDPGDDLPLSTLLIGQPDPGRRVYWGPHLLVNTTLNLVAGSDLAWRSRKGESFLLSSLYCGAKGVGYVKVDTADVQTRENLTLGRAISISGAAVDPNMRAYQSRSLTALLTLFNARLGAWMQNPRMTGQKKTWTAESPGFAGLLVTELLGKTDGTSEYVHLSDGGHFENMGVYELIRRRCRYIVAVDASDETMSSASNLAILIRLCRIDFGIRIQIDTAALQPQGPDRLTKTHVAIGRIRYDDVDQGQLPGVLVYVKISMTGDEAPDLQNYAGNDSGFPYQITDLRQSFDEEQFECYRCLGDHIATQVFEDAANRLRGESDRPHLEYVPLLFAALQARWTNAPELEDENFVESTRPWIALQHDFRTDPDLARLSRELYPELPPAPQTATPLKDPDRAEAHAVSQMLQIMENTWLTLGLRQNADLPLNRGWVNTFRRWVNTAAFQRLWPALRSEYGVDFCRFCEEDLHLAVVKPKAVQIDDPAASAFESQAIALLTEEYRREWPFAPAPTLTDLIDRARRLVGAGRRPPVWLIVQEPSPPLPAAGGDQPTGKTFVAGIILAASYDALTTDFPGLDTSRATLRGQSPVELAVWVRRGYRSTLLAWPCLRDVLETELPAILVDANHPMPTLWARYPRPGESGENDHEWGVWLEFLARFDFRRCHPNESNNWTSTLLRR